MALYLVQHGKSLPKAVDPDKGLSREGFDETTRIAEVARHYQIPVHEIHHSGKKRSRQTADIMAATLSTPTVSVLAGINPMDDPVAFADILPWENSRMLVSHLPFLDRLASYLITGTTKIQVFQFQNSGIVCLAQTNDAPHWHIKWTLMPNIA